MSQKQDDLIRDMEQLIAERTERQKRAGVSDDKLPVGLLPTWVYRAIAAVGALSWRINWAFRKFRRKD